MLSIGNLSISDILINKIKFNNYTYLGLATSFDKYNLWKFWKRILKSPSRTITLVIRDSRSTHSSTIPEYNSRSGRAYARSENSHAFSGV